MKTIPVFAERAERCTGRLSATRCYNASDETLLCTAGTHVHSPEMVAVEVTLNGQQYSAHGQTFEYFSPPTATMVSPTGGPSAGGTAIVINGTDFGGGSDYRCSDLADSSKGLLPATFVDGTVRCTTTPLDAADLAAMEASGTGSFVHQMSVRLNGQQDAAVAPDEAFHGISETELRLQIWPSPSLTGFSPSCGPADGGTAVLLSGAKMRNTSKPFDELRCRLANFTWPATYLSAEALRCTTPAAAEVGYSSVMEVDFTDESLVGATGTAAAPGARLTTSGLLMLGGTQLRTPAWKEPYGWLRSAAPTRPRSPAARTRAPCRTSPRRARQAGRERLCRAGRRLAAAATR